MLIISFLEAILHIHAGGQPRTTTFLVKCKLAMRSATRQTNNLQSVAKNCQNYTWVPNYGSFHPRLIWNRYLLFSACFKQRKSQKIFIYKAWNYLKLKIFLALVLWKQTWWLSWLRFICLNSLLCSIVWCWLNSIFLNKRSVPPCHLLFMVFLNVLWSSFSLVPSTRVQLCCK